MHSPNLRFVGFLLLPHIVTRINFPRLAILHHTLLLLIHIDANPYDLLVQKSAGNAQTDEKMDEEETAFKAMQGMKDAQQNSGRDGVGIDNPAIRNAYMESQRELFDPNDDGLSKIRQYPTDR